MDLKVMDALRYVTCPTMDTLIEGENGRMLLNVNQRHRSSAVQQRGGNVAGAAKTAPAQ
jgi:hypothetical protein